MASVAIISIEDIVLNTPDKIVKLVKFSGQLDETNVDEKSKIIYDLIDNVPNKTAIIFDFSDLQYMNSKSIGYVGDWYSKIVAKGGKLVIARARENIMDILSVVGLSKILDICMTLEEAKLKVM